jgi:hypothetical protein
MIMKNSIVDELSNKVYHLSKALDQVQKVLSILEEENLMLKKILQEIDDHKTEEKLVA